MADSSEAPSQPRIRIRPSPCLEEGSFRDELTRRGVAPDQVATNGAPPIEVNVEHCAPFEREVFVGKMCSLAPDGSPITTMTTATSCEDVVTLLADAVTSLVEGRSPPERSAPPPERKRARRQGRPGGGGIAVTGVLVGVGDNPVSHGVRAYAATYSGRRGAPRWGGGAELTVRDGRRATSRAGMLVGWGAPWNDLVVGFVGEAGAFQIARGDATPFLGATFVMQFPARIPVRPIFGFSTLWLPLLQDDVHDGGDRLVLALDGGLVWQAW